MTGNIVIFDTSVLIDHLRTNKFARRFSEVMGLIRNSSVVLSELACGATRESEIDFVLTLAKNYPTLTPSENNWIESGIVLSSIRKDKGFLSDKLRDIHFDVLIALTARSFGATVITSNKMDFQLIQRYRSFNLETW